MDPYSWAMLIMGAISTAASLTSGVDVETEVPALPGGGSPDIQPIIGGATPPKLPPNVPDLAGPAAAAQKAGAGPKLEVTPGPTIPTPAQPVPTSPELPNQGPTAKIPTTGAPANPEIGQVLAAIPDALAAVAPLLGLGPQPIGRQITAPVAGGQPGGLVGQFNTNFGSGQNDIGQLLAALPGIGR